MNHVGLTGFFRCFLNDVTRLLLGSDHQNFFSIHHGVVKEFLRYFEVHEGFLEVDDVDPAFSAVNEALHFRIPTFGLVTEV